LKPATRHIFGCIRTASGPDEEKEIISFIRGSHQWLA